MASDGTYLKLACTHRGEKTEYGYDFRHRLAGTTVHPRDGKSLTTSIEYRYNYLFSTTDPYGRKSFNAYRSSDGALIRTIQGTKPSFTLANNAAVLAYTRPAYPNANGAAIVTDYLLDAEGHTTETIDPRGVHHKAVYDSRGRAIESIEAFEVALTISQPVLS